MADLHLNLKGEYFNDIKAGTKSWEYRLASKWLKRLTSKKYERIFVKHGYPASDDLEKIVVRPWRGFEMQTITHPHFGDKPVLVCAIRVN